MAARSRSSSGLSGAQIDKAGKTLRDFQARSVLDLATYAKAQETLRRFRREWTTGAQPLTGVYMGVVSMVGTLHIPGKPVTRLKREPRIIDKLTRQSIALSQMQDIGGVRM